MSESSPHGFKGLDRIFDTATATGTRPDWMESLKPKIIIEPPTSPSTPKAAKQAKLAWHGDGAVANKEDTSSPTWSSLMASIGQQALLPKKPTGSSLIDRLFDTATGAGKQEKSRWHFRKKRMLSPNSK